MIAGVSGTEEVVNQSYISK